MKNFLQNNIHWFCFIGYVFLFPFYLSSLSAMPESEIVAYSKLRAELLNRIIILETKVATLEKITPGGPINIYEVDTNAGKLVCRKCDFEENKK